MTALNRSRLINPLSATDALRLARLVVALSTIAFGVCTQAQLRPREHALADDSVAGYRPITARERLKWFAISTAGPQSLAVGVFSSGFGTGIDSPKEYGPHWDGFGKRYGLRLTGVSTGNAIEAALGSAWGEDPRYFRSPEQPFKTRVAHVIKMTFLAQRPDGRTMPAYARYVAIPGNNFLSNTWRPDSNSQVSDAVVRTLVGFVGKMSSNAFLEFAPDAWNLAKRKNSGK